MLKVKLILIAFCLFAVALSHTWISRFDQGFEQGRKQSDQEAFDSYVNFNRKFQKEVKKIKREQKHQHQRPVNTASSKSVWDVVE